jgi:hypothetical protein
VKFLKEMVEKLIEIEDVWKKYEMGKAGTLVVLKELVLIFAKVNLSLHVHLVLENLR